MRSLLRFLLTLAVSLLAMLAFRALAFTIYTVDGEGLQPEFEAGDHVLVNRWSYGLRTGRTGGLFSYGRLLRRKAERGDIVAYEDPADSTHTRVLLGCLRALPGDTLSYQGRMELVPSLKNCADADYYWIGAPGKTGDSIEYRQGLVSEQLLIGRVVLVVYNHSPQASLLQGWNTERLLLRK